uniref:Uncharacterized protein n=1 Tax=Brassica oleracea TaxID=3712 RepID=A0A3P6ER08_BRAOL|nr:unnamed protein product [Brassica oleracea]
MFGLGFVGNVGHFWYGGLDKFIKLKLRYVPKSTRFVAQWQWMIYLYSSHNGISYGFSFAASPSDIVCVPETTQFNTDSGFIGNITTSTSVSPTSSAPLVFAAAGTLSLSTLVVDLKCKSSVDGLRDSCLQLSNAKGSNRFANLAMLEEDIQLDVVTSPSQSMSPSVETSAQFVYNSSLPSTPSSFSDLFVDNVLATSSDNFDMAQRSRGYGSKYEIIFILKFHLFRWYFVLLDLKGKYSF